MTDRTSGIDPADVEQVRVLAQAARAASRRLALLSRADKDAALRTLAICYRALERDEDANALVARAQPIAPPPSTSMV